MKKKRDLKKERNLLIIGVLFLVIVIIGSTYAFFSYSRSAQAFTLTSNGITARFNNSGGNHIDFQDAFPLSDSYAISNLENLSYADFTVSGNVEDEEEAITYEIYLTEKSGNTLDSRYVKIYLTDGQNNVVAGPSTYASLESTNYTQDASTGKLVFRSRVLGNFEDSYKLYAWIDSSYNENAENTFDFYVNLYAYNS